MLNFIDANVLIGYCILADRWHDQCQIIDNINNIWLSDKVLAEWSRKEIEIYKKRESLINRHRQDVRKNFPDMIEIDHRDKLIKRTSGEIRQFIERFYRDEIDFPLTRDELCNSIDLILLKIQSEKYQRFNLLKSRYNQHRRTKEYPQENKDLEKCVHNGNGDRGIVIDAHDLSLNLPGQNLRFLTLDNDLSGECKDLILKNLKIFEIIDLKYCPPALHLNPKHSPYTI
jgi:hypothetical protein